MWSTVVSAQTFIYFHLTFAGPNAQYHDIGDSSLLHGGRGGDGGHGGNPDDNPVNGLYPATVG